MMILTLAIQYRELVKKKKKELSTILSIISHYTFLVVAYTTVLVRLEQDSQFGTPGAHLLGEIR